ncbi:hypothetical protein LY71_107125 [Geodermatophilus tzadiensis]|uniref:Galactose mutarotase-like enzyme n=1 Tax=Geodermatophilus tzadiensis TaxID=1137988 RepID=A0A2T0TTR9_9ACTN|nr:hypothetical protein [Geodermatophilus tzadiensis]PRY49043.1 hypothetical protein LY71_107125 [Geodermatophilus tzadiensis]
MTRPASEPAGLTWEVDLAHGARLTGLTDPRGRQWLADDDRPGRRPGGPDDRFTDGPLAGWDEMLPSIDPCLLDEGGRQVAVGDHGDLWCRPWSGDVTEHAVDGASLPFRLRRRVTGTPCGIRLDYELTVTGDRVVPLLWAAHPQFALRPGTRLVLPEPVPVLRVDGDDPESGSWPATVDPGRLVAPGGCGKWYVDPTGSPALHGAALVDPDGGWLRLTWDPGDLPYLGIWLDRGHLAAGDVLAIEPSSGFYDRLDRAAAAGNVWTVAPGRPRRWWVALDAGEDGEPWRT